MLAALERLAVLAKAECDAAARNDVDGIGCVSRDRLGLMAEIEPIAHGLEQARSRIVGHLELARASGHFPTVVSRHREGERLVDAILALDRDTLASLDLASRHRRDVALSIETGEATLAAYRRVIAPPPLSAGLVDQRG
jgi:hypothetical protein